MDIVLRYRGPLSTSPRRAVANKQTIRDYIHPQLEQLCVPGGAFEGAAGPMKTVCRGRFMDTQAAFRRMFLSVDLGGYEIVPLVIRHLNHVCHLDITWLRRESPGSILQGGDLDNRLKTLFDGLTMPHDEGQIHTTSPTAGLRQYCLLEDDSLITKLSVTTHQLLEPPLPGEHRDDVDLLLRVTLNRATTVAHDL